mmetsp:Transcript_43382/g.100503  ORF Transcript_43382/g.100503 Transcript_43382/m.100503 type:complete len:214 (-) Transcript_43382:2661-3302(-)
MSHRGLQRHLELSSSKQVSRSVQFGICRTWYLNWYLLPSGQRASRAILVALKSSHCHCSSTPGSPVHFQGVRGSPATGSVMTRPCRVKVSDPSCLLGSESPYGAYSVPVGAGGRVDPSEEGLAGPSVGSGEERRADDELVAFEVLSSQTLEQESSTYKEPGAAVRQTLFASFCQKLTLVGTGVVTIMSDVLDRKTPLSVVLRLTIVREPWSAS